MKFTVQQSTLKAHLDTIGRAIPSRPSHPILANVKVDVGADAITLTGFDLSTSIQSSFSAAIEVEGSTTIPYALFKQIISTLDGELTIEVDEQVTITSATGKFTIHCQSGEEYPEIPEIKGEPISIPIDVLRDGLAKTLFSTSTDESKQVLTGVHLTTTTDNIELASTDGHRLSVTTYEASIATEDPLDTTIPRKALEALRNLIAATDQEAIVMQFDGTQLAVALNDQRITSRLLEGQYPKYHQLIPKQFSKAATIDRKQLISSLERVQILADQKSGIIKLSFSNDTQEIVISADCADVGSGKETLSAQVSDYIEIAFNVKYLLEGLKAMDSNEVLISADSDRTPVVLQPINGGKMTYLVMPVQVRS